MRSRNFPHGLVYRSTWEIEFGKWYSGVFLSKMKTFFRHFVQPCVSRQLGHDKLDCSGASWLRLARYPYFKPPIPFRSLLFARFLQSAFLTFTAPSFTVILLQWALKASSYWYLHTTDSHRRNVCERADVQQFDGTTCSTAHLTLPGRREILEMTDSPILSHPKILLIRSHVYRNFIG